MLPTLLLAACQLAAATRQVGSDSGSGSGSDGGAAAADDTGAVLDGGADGGAAPTEDLDQDGWTEAEGDCDDLDAGVNPGAHDGCDQRDEDCDGEVDEDALEDDPTEPNELVPWDLGNLDDDPSVQVLARLHNDEDLDRFTFRFEDSGWGLFELRVSVSNIPSGSRYHVVVEHLEEGGGIYLDEVGSGTLAVTIADELLEEDGGDWEIRVESESGADCGRDYLVTVELD